MNVIVVTNVKGGSAKTTTAVCLAAALGQRWGSTRLLDADAAQQSAADWSNMWGQAHEAGDTRIPVPYTWEPVLPADIQAAVDQANDDGVEYVVVDTIGTGIDPSQILPCLAVANIALIPLADSLMDVHVIRPTLALCGQASADNPGLGVLMVITQVRAGTSLTEAIRSTLADSFGLPVLETMVPMRERLKQGLGAPVGAWNPVLGVAYEIAGEPPSEAP